MSRISGEQAGPSGRLHRLLNEFQRDFPLSPRPFRDIADRLNWQETAVIEALAGLQRDGLVARVGPVIRPNTVGVSTLAAMAVPRQRLATVAGLVSRQPAVNHNYEREHRFNLWFVATASDSEALSQTVRRIEADNRLPVMVLPMLDDYYIDLGFDLNGGPKPGAAAACKASLAIDALDRRLLDVMQDGLSLAARPYAAAARMAGTSEKELLERMGALIEAGVIKRHGIIVRHHECGYRHNAMVVWDVPDDAVHAVGRKLAGQEAIRLCYRRPRRRPEWPYNLFCMIHGRDRRTVRDQVRQAAASAGLQDLPRDILFSVRRFKQRGARYGLSTPALPGRGAVA